MLNAIFKQVDENFPLTREEALELLKIDEKGSDFYRLLGKANELSRREYRNRGYIFAQIGINAAPCSGNCRFCSLAKDNFTIGNRLEKGMDEILAETSAIVSSGVDALFLMTTADYPQERFLEIGRKVKPLLPESIAFIANVGDFGPDYAAELKKVGFTGVYHIVRLREGLDTDLPPKRRIATLDAIKGAGLELYYCVEPIGKEHTDEELVDEMLRARDYGVDVMAVMRRVGVPGTRFVASGETSELRMVKIAAVTRLVTRPKRSMNIHEPMKMALLAGVNQLYAEVGVNPRDNESQTEKGRGMNISAIRKMLQDAEYDIHCPIAVLSS